MENVHTFVALPPVRTVPFNGPRSRRMGGYIEPQSFPPPSPSMEKPNTPPDSPRSESPPKLSPSRASPVPPPPPPPPRSPLRDQAKSVASFQTLVDLYTKRDTMRTLRPRHGGEEEEESSTLDPSSLTSVLNKLNLNTPYLPPTPSVDLSSMDSISLGRSKSDKPLPQPPTDSNPSSPIMTAKHSADTSDTWTVSSHPSEMTVTNGADVSETSTLLTLPSTLSSTLSGISKREHALKELLSSERAYASDLAFIRDVHIPMALGKNPPFHLPDTATPPSSGSSTRTRSTASDSSSVSQILGAPMTRDDVRIIFGNIKELACFSDAFGDALEEALGDVLEDGTDEDYVGDLFLRIIPEMEPLYKQYITKHSSALAHLEALPQTPSLINYMTQTQILASSVTHAWDLASLLIKPVQRLLKYPLLLATIAEQTPEDHGDKQNLLKACDAIEQIARGINDSRRRLEVVREVLTGKPQSSIPALQKKKLSSGNASLMRMKSMGASLRASRQKAGSNEEALRVEAYEKRLKECDGFIRELAKRIVAWAQQLRISQEHLRDWAVGFGKTIGISEEHPSDAFNAFLELINSRLLPLCKELDDIIAKEILPSLARLIDSSKAPKKLLEKMHSLKSQHNELLNTNLSSKHRPSPSLLEASQTYQDIRAQLDVELPAYLSLLDRGLVACIMQFARYQTQFWSHVRDEWGTLWDCLRMEGETNAGCEETFRLWWTRYSEVEGAIRKLRVLDPSAEEPKATRSRSKSFGPIPDPDSSMALPFGTSYPTPDSPFSGQSHRHRSFGSLDSTTQRRMQRSPSVEAFQSTSPTRSRSQPRTPDNLGRRKGRSNTSPLPSSTSSPTLTDYINNMSAVHSHAAPKGYTESLRSSSDVRGRQSRSGSFSRRFSESLRAPIRKTTSQKSLGSVGASSVSSRQFSEPEPMPPCQHYDSVPPDSPTQYYVRVIHPLDPPRGTLYMNLPFFRLRMGESYGVLSELGHPSRYPDLPVHVDEREEDTLLIVRNDYGELGLALASFLIPCES